VVPDESDRPRPVRTIWTFIPLAPLSSNPSNFRTGWREPRSDLVVHAAHVFLLIHPNSSRLGGKALEYGAELVLSLAPQC